MSNKKAEIMEAFVQHWVKVNDDNMQHVTLRDWLITFTILTALSMKSAGLNQEEFEQHESSITGLLRMVWSDVNANISSATLQ